MNGTRPSPTRERADLLLGAGTCLAALALYLGTLAPWLTWANQGADGGDLIAAAMASGVPHPSGYPTYVLLGRLAALLPAGSIAYRFHVFSAVAAAASAGTVYASALVLLRGRAAPARRLLAAAAALAWAAGRTLWSQAVIAEVYALSALVVGGVLYLSLRDDLAGAATYWATLGLTIGVGLGVHLTLVLALPGLVILWWPRLQAQPRRAAWLAGGLMVGLGVYLYLPLAARLRPPVCWGQPDTWHGFWWLVSGRLYHGYAFGLSLAALPARLSYWARLWGAQAGWHTLALGLLGGRLLWERDRRRGTALGAIFAAYTLYALGYATSDSTVYLIPAFLVGTLWAAEGLAVTWEWLRARRGVPPWARAALGAALLCAPAGWAVASNITVVDASADLGAFHWARDVAEALPPGALVITGDDRHTFTLAYLQWAEGRRKDLLVVDGDLWQQPWYAAQVAARAALPGLTPPCPLADLARLAVDERPVALTTWRGEVAEGLGVTLREGYWVLGKEPLAGR